MVLANYFMQMETSMKVSGQMIKLTEKESTYMPTELIMMESGSWINNKDLELKYGLMELNTKDISKMGRSKVLAS